MKNNDIIIKECLYEIIKDITELQIKLLDITDENNVNKQNIANCIIYETVERIGRMYSKAFEVETMIKNSKNPN